MERILYFDCFAGISGDMSIAALLDLGIDEKQFLAELDKLGLEGYVIEISKVNRFSITGTDVRVKLDDNFACTHSHEEGSCHTHHDGERSLGHIIHIINSSQISDNAKKYSIAIFSEIAKAEAFVHGKSIEDVHFHEVGAIDSIVDIVGTAICIDILNLNKIVCSPVHDGKGFVKCAHGTLPIPVPAVAQMLKNSGIAMVVEEIEAELVTPTGFGIIKTLKQECGSMPPMEIEAVGYGFGKTHTGRLNALRVFLGVSSKGKVGFDGIGALEDEVILLETNLDDCTGEVLGYTMNKLMEEGALDVYFTPIQMKKCRPAQMLSVLCEEKDKNKMAKIIFGETRTLGLRVSKQNRLILNRDVRTVQTEFGPINAKFAEIDGSTVCKPEFDDCIKIAQKNNLNLKTVQEKIKVK